MYGVDIKMKKKTYNEYIKFHRCTVDKNILYNTSYHITVNAELTSTISDNSVDMHMDLN